MCVIGIDFTWNKIFMRCKQWFHTMDNLNDLCKQAMQHFVTTLRIFNGPGCIKMWHELTLYQLLICHSWIFRSAPVFYTSVWADNQLKAIWAHTPGAKFIKCVHTQYDVSRHRFKLESMRQFYRERTSLPFSRLPHAYINTTNRSHHPSFLTHELPTTNPHTQ